MNKKRRMKNRGTARKLAIDNAPLCPECGQKGPHWVGVPMTLGDMLSGTEPGGFWLCDKFYGPDGKRLPANAEITGVARSRPLEMHNVEFSGDAQRVRTNDGLEDSKEIGNMTREDAYHTCGSCLYWSHATRRQCGNPDTPVYYAECLYPIENVVLPHCINVKEMNAVSGTGCPCWEVADDGNDPVNRRAGFIGTSALKHMLAVACTNHGTL